MLAHGFTIGDDGPADPRQVRGRAARARRRGLAQDRNRAGADRGRGAARAREGNAMTAGLIPKRAALSHPSSERGEKVHAVSVALRRSYCT
jgi:hypothetical protein